MAIGIVLGVTGIAMVVSAVHMRKMEKNDPEMARALTQAYYEQNRFNAYMCGAF